MANSYAYGQSVLLTAAFVDDDGDAANPSSVTCTLISPSGVETTLTPVNTATGAYEAVVQPDAPGKWLYQWTGTSGTVRPAGESSFRVRSSRFYP